MKRRKIFVCLSTLSVITCLTIIYVQQGDAAIIPPPWSDPEKNPCATMPGGYPCPETMELSPTATIGSSKKNLMANAPVAECRCPPGTALSAQNNKCYKIYERGPCSKGQYFSPVAEMQTGNKRTTNRWGVCKSPRICPENTVYWPMDGKCYTRLTKGPCTKGKLLVLNDEDLAECKCENKGQLSPYYYDLEESCYEHFTKGPCYTPGQLFLPGGSCDCHPFLPHYHEIHQMCYELNTPGPCPPGHTFRLPENVNALEDNIFSRSALKAQCQCKDGYVPWSDGLCYRLFTRGPCETDEFLINATTCVHNFCGKNRLYFPDQNQCYRIGSQGPCDLHQVVVFDFTSRPSVDGISFNGMCGCAGIIMNLDQQCGSPSEATVSSACESTPGMVELEGNCYKLYTRGPCGPGQWLEPVKSLGANSAIFLESKAKCVCRPGYTTVSRDQNTTSVPSVASERCNAPTVGLARLWLYHKIP